MINSNMRDYNYFLYGEQNDYGQSTLIKDDNGEPKIQGTIKMSINNTNTSIQDNILYRDASYLGLTHDKAINDTYVIEYGKERLKVLYIIPSGRYTQVFMKSIDG